MPSYLMRRLNFKKIVACKENEIYYLIHYFIPFYCALYTKHPNQINNKICIFLRKYASINIKTSLWLCKKGKKLKGVLFLFCCL